MNTAYSDTRQHLLSVGHQLMASRGFSAVGLNEILQTAGVPKGSFYHYFKSKELYGQAVLDDYFVRYLASVEQRFAPSGLIPAAEQLMGYWRDWQTGYSSACSAQTCLVVKLSAEVADLSEAMRLTLRDGTDQIVARLAQVIEAGQTDGSLSHLHARAICASSLAAMLYQVWLGASLLAKIHRTGQPMQHAMRTTCLFLEK